MHALFLALLLLVPAPPGWAQTAKPAPKEATEPVIKQLEALYELVLESGQWKINGVTAKPDPGLV